MKIEHQKRTVNLPDALMVGAAKCGTTTLYHHLSHHPKIYFPKGKKEPFYFSFGGTKPHYQDEDFVSKLVWDTDAYLKLYEDAAEGELLMDGSTSYLYDAEKSIAHIKQLYGDRSKEVKIIVILRNPVDRAYSHYTYLVRNGVEDLPFDEAIKPEIIEARKHQRWGFDYLEYGRYTRQVRAFQEHFDNVHVCLFEDLKNSQELADQLFEFLELDSVSIESKLKSNPSGIPTNKVAVKLLLSNKVLKKAVNLMPQTAKRKLLHQRDKVLGRFLKRDKMRQDIRQNLEQFFEQEIAQLAELINRDLTHWKAQ